ncbi:hypothetical protein PF007_g11501 [Phytophthora fragariae]|uniref:Uncharacterized protein n=1 Tax=Phytophthora fragariae TaxID=53985 RepID=A0A6A3U9I8_9STRA|nr:hypothetical protein PF007_g11501 [Phytophthora fragariae]KAE9143648.1 hypothetical protein PF006_g11345 [Phytophthora fragariae]KAE9308122.1 hypothetical protein PF001_g11306 [Phytophthora fragariae]
MEEPNENVSGRLETKKDVSETLEEVGDSLETHESEEYVPRKRTSKHQENLDIMEEQRTDIVNVVAPLPARVLKTWMEFDTVMAAYKKVSNLHFRIHSSDTVETYKRFGADGGRHLSYRDMKRDHTHNPTPPEVATSYLTTKTIPMDEQDREDVKTLADTRASSKHITNFLNVSIDKKA